MNNLLFWNNSCQIPKSLFSKDIMYGDIFKKNDSHMIDRMSI